MPSHLTLLSFLVILAFLLQVTMQQIQQPNDLQMSPLQKIQQNLKKQLEERFQYSWKRVMMETVFGFMQEPKQTKEMTFEESEELQINDQLPQFAQNILQPLQDGSRKHNAIFSNPSSSESSASSFNWDEWRQENYQNSEITATTDITAVPTNPCHNTALYISYPNTTYICNGTEVTLNRYDTLRVDSANNCTAMNITEYGCFCSIDRTDSDCRKERTFRCEAALIDPIRVCETPQEKYGGLSLEGDYPCIYLTTKTIRNFTFTMNCKFTAVPFFNLSTGVQKKFPTSQDVNYTIIATGNIVPSRYRYQSMPFLDLFPLFSYEIYAPIPPLGINQTRLPFENFNPSFARWKRMTQSFLFKPYNFFTWSDFSGVQSQVLSDGQQYIGLANITYPVNFTSFSTEFYAGARFYAEAGYFDMASSAMSMGYERVFVDFTDYKPPPFVDTYAIILGTTIPAGIIAFLILCLIVGIVALVKYRQNRAWKAELYGDKPAAQNKKEK